MAKKIKLLENTVVTKDEKGNLSLVGFAKEALTSFDKMNVDVTIFLHEHKKDDVEKLLKENDVPYKNIITSDDKKEDEDFDLCVVGGNVIELDEWKWTAENVIRKLFDKENKQPLSEQDEMNRRLAQIKKYAQERSKSKKGDAIVAY